MKNIHVKALALSLGVTWGACMLIFGWLGALGWGLPAIHVTGSFYIGFGPSFLGGLVGAFWGFVDGIIMGAVIGYLYNYFSAQLTKKR